MNCRKVKKNIESYIDSTLTEEQKSSIDDHVKSCPECKNIFEQRLITGEILYDLLHSSVKDLEPSQKLINNVRNGVSKLKNRSKPFWLTIPPHRLAVYSLIFLMFVVLGMFFGLNLLDNVKEHQPVQVDSDNGGSFIKYTVTTFADEKTERWISKKMYMKRANGETSILDITIIKKTDT